MTMIKFIFDIAEAFVTAYLFYRFIDAPEPGEKIEIIVIFGIELLAMLTKFVLTLWAICVTNKAMGEHDIGFDYDEKDFKHNFLSKQIL